MSLYRHAQGAGDYFPLGSPGEVTLGTVRQFLFVSKKVFSRQSASYKTPFNGCFNWTNGNFMRRLLGTVTNENVSNNTGLNLSMPEGLKRVHRA